MRKPERVAWGVLLIAFAVFCLTCVFSTVAVYWFFFESRVPMDVVTEPSRGTLGLRAPGLPERVVRGTEELPAGNAIRPNQLDSQAVIAFADPYLEGKTIATVMLKGGESAITLVTAERPRFEWGSPVYEIRMENVEGDIDVHVAQDSTISLTFDMITIQGDRVSFGKSGKYSILTTDSMLQVTNHQGEAALIPHDQNQGWPISAGSTSRVMNDSSAVIPAEMPENLLENGTFQAVVGEQPDKWGCRPGVQNLPSSRFITGFLDGQPILQFLRGDNATTNGETSCIQGLQSGDEWIDVSDYDSLILRIMFQIESQSLSVCGEIGTECPLMVRIGYIPEELPEDCETESDAEVCGRELIYGFYAALDPTRDYPLRCEFCLQPHIFVQPGVWYTYESENIMSILPDGERPRAISYVRFYASGHEYDTRVSEVQLLAGDNQRATLTDAITP